MKLSLSLLLLTAIALCGPTTTSASQAPAEGLLDLREIAAWLPGNFDNDPQRAFLQGMKRGADAPPRMHLQIKADSAASTPSDRSFEISARNGSEHDAVALQARWQLRVDPADQRVSMQTIAADGRSCTVRWARQVDSFVGVAAPGCERAAFGVPGTLRLGSDELWIDDAAAVVPNKLYRAARFDCFVALRLRNGKAQAITGLSTHDRGGTIDIQSEDTPPRKLRLLLRRGLWPSNSGNNFVQLMSLYVYEDDPENPLANGWATPESGRVGFGVGDELPGGQSLSARCTRQSSTG